MSRTFDFLEPWQPAGEFSNDLELELQKEVGEGHPLHGCTPVALAQRLDCDDVLFRVGTADGEFAVVHLTWSGSKERSPDWPGVEFFKSLQEWRETYNKIDRARSS